MKYINHNPRVKDLKTWAALLVLIVLVPLLSSNYIDEENPILIITIFSLLGFFVFNLVIRKSLSFKTYFTSKYNVFTTKVWSEKAFDLPKGLMFEKIKEVLEHSRFKLVDTNKDTFELLATSSITFKSWGENVYISFETKGDETVMIFCSSTFFGMHDWGKNEQNFSSLLTEIESSFTI